MFFKQCGVKISIPIKPPIVPTNACFQQFTTQQGLKKLILVTISPTKFLLQPKKILLIFNINLNSLTSHNRNQVIFLHSMQAPKQIELPNFIEESEVYPMVDVRAPIEYKNGHIPGAINIPLFEDHERAEIGTIYKLRGKEDAVLRGLEIVSPKLADFVKSVKKLNDKGKVLVYCFRGGMRSNSFATLMNTAGVKAEVLKGGYKNYRKGSLQFYENKLQLIVLGGPTGSGKTEVLQELKKLNEQVIDLEGLAQHKGSAFGSIHQEDQPSQQNFENNLFREFLKMDLGRPIWLENESFSIGSIKLPYPLWLQMKQAPLLKLMIPFKARVQRLIREYGSADIQVLKNTVLRIQKRLGGLQTKQTLEHLNNNEAEKVTEILLSYYDSAYQYDHQTNECKHTIEINSLADDPETNAGSVLEVAKNITW